MSFNIIIGQEKPIRESDLIGCWQNYPEENKFHPDFTVYRSCKYKSSLKRILRYRDIIDLKPNGICRYKKLSANDAHAMHDGKWVFDSDSSILRIMDLNGNVVKKMNLVRIEKQLLGVNKTNYN